MAFIAVKGLLEPSTKNKTDHQKTEVGTAFILEMPFFYNTQKNKKIKLI